jgi:hypothetical protein
MPLKEKVLTAGGRLESASGAAFQSIRFVEKLRTAEDNRDAAKNV